MAMAIKETRSYKPESRLHKFISETSLKVLNAIEARYSANRPSFDMGGRKDSDVFFNTLKSEIKNGRNPVLATISAFTNLRIYLEQNQEKHNPGLLAGVDLFLGALIAFLPEKENKTGFSLQIINMLYRVTNVLLSETEHSVRVGDIEIDIDDNSGLPYGGRVRGKKKPK